MLEPVLYDVAPYFGSRDHNGFDEVEIYADVTGTVRRAENRLIAESYERDDKVYDGVYNAARRALDDAIDHAHSAAHRPAFTEYPDRPHFEIGQV